MSKVIKNLAITTLHTLAGVVLALFLLILTLALALSMPRMQTLTAQAVVEWLNNKTNTNIHIGKISIEELTTLAAENIYVEDLKGDTLLWVNKATANIDRKALLQQGTLLPRNIKVEEGLLDMFIDSLGKDNLQNLIDHIAAHFNTDTTATNTTLRLETIEIEQFQYRLYDQKFAGRTPQGVIDYSAMDIDIATANIGAIEIEDATVRLSNIDNLNATDRSGASLQHSALEQLTIGKASLDFRGVDFRSDNTHLRLPYLLIEANDWKEYADFCDKVTLRLETRNSTLQPASAGRFVEALGTLQLEGRRISGTFDGKVCDFVADITAQLYNSEVSLAGNVVGLLHPERINANIELELGTTPNKVAHIYRNIVKQPLPQEGEKWLAKFDTLALGGSFELHPTYLVANAQLNTNLGNVDVDGSLNISAPNYTFEGSLSGSNVALGQLLAVEELGQSDIQAQGVVAMAQEGISGSVIAVVERLGWKEYEFADIEVSAEVQDGVVAATASSTDPSLAFVMEGSGNIDNAPNAEYNLLLNIERANLTALGITPKEEQSTWLTANIEAYAEGNNIDEMNGRAMINNLAYATPTDTLSTELVNIALTSTSAIKNFSLYSPIADVEYHSSAPYAQVVEFFTKKIPSQLPLALHPNGTTIPTDTTTTPSLEGRLYAADDYSAMSINIKEGEALASVVVPNSNLAPDSSLSLEFSPSAGEFTLMLDSEYLIVDDVVVSQFHIDADGTGERITLNGECEELLAMGLSVPEVSLEASCAHNEELELALFFSNSDAALSGRLNIGANIALDSLGRVVATATLGDSYLLLPSERWNITTNGISYTPDGVAIDNFRMGNNVGGIWLNGNIADHPSTPLTLGLDNIALGEWLTVTGVTEGVDGTLDGLIRLESLTSDPYGEGSIVFSSLNVGGVDIDPMGIDLEIPRGTTKLNVELNNMLLESTLMVGSMDYNTGDYNTNLSIEQIDLSMVGPLLDNVVSDTKGMGSVDMTLSGTRGTLDVDGSLRLNDFATRVAYTGALYSAQSVAMHFENNRGYITPLRIEDGEGGWAEMEGYINFQRLDDINLGISLVPHNLVAIDLAENSDSDFYGKVYASGGAHLTTEGGNTEISGALSTGAGSVFNIPLKGNNDFAGADFVTFVDISEVVEEDNGVVAQMKNELRNSTRREQKGGLNVDMMLGVDTQTQLRLIIDPETDNVIEARGVADLGVTLDSRKENLEIRGDYQISEGVYNFNFQNLITKQFTINPDSYIRWNGNPEDANIDVGATYKLKTSLAPLLGTESTASRASTPVECIVNLTGSLSKVDVSFDINVPTANTEYQSILSSYFSSQEMMATQFVYLLALGNFYSDTTTGPTTTAGTAGTAIGLDFLATQVSRLVSNDAYKFNLKYKAIDDTSSSYSIDFQTEIIDDRLLLELEANVDTGDYYQSINGDNNQLSGGGALTLLLDDSGDFYLKGFSRTIDRFDENQGLQENGVGLYYKRSFNRFSDLWRKKKRTTERESEKSDNFASEQKEHTSTRVR